MKFSYFLPAKLSFGFGAVDTIGAEARGLGASRALVVTDKVMVKTGIAKRVMGRLQGIEFEVFDEVEAEPRIEVAQAVADRVRSRPYDCVVGFGRELGIEVPEHYYESKSIQALEYGKGKKWAFPIN